MIKPEFFLNFLEKNNINFFTGVPDSVLKEFSSQLQTLNFHERISNLNVQNQIGNK